MNLATRKSDAGRLSMLAPEPPKGVRLRIGQWPDQPFAGYFGPWPLLDAPQRLFQVLRPIVMLDVRWRLSDAWAHLVRGTCDDDDAT